MPTITRKNTAAGRWWWPTSLCAVARFTPSPGTQLGSRRGEPLHAHDAGAAPDAALRPFFFFLPEL